MMRMYLLFSIAFCEGLNNLPVHKEPDDENLIICVKDIVNKHFTKFKWFTYVDSQIANDDLLKAIHATNNITIVSRKSIKKLYFIRNRAYLIIENNVIKVIGHIKNLKKEPSWNPYARFLIVVKLLERADFKVIFDFLMEQHIENVVITDTSFENNLYTYNSFENFGCGKRYDRIINYGVCSKASKQDLYPHKHVTELLNCNLTAILTHWPPYVILFTKETQVKPRSKLSLGVEPYILQLIGKKEGFHVNFIQTSVVEDTEESEFPKINDDMETNGSFGLLMRNKADFMVGGMLLLASRVDALDYAYGHTTFTDELLFLVRKSTTVSPWKLIYLAFKPIVWLLLLLSLALCSTVILLLMRSEDRSIIVLKLLRCLFLHGSGIRCGAMVKCMIIFWVWFAYLMNTIYQSSFISLIADPPTEFQISNEEHLTRYQFKPCFSSTIRFYYDDSVKVQEMKEGCYDKMLDSIETVSKSDDMYTIMLHELYKYHKELFFDQYGNNQIYYFHKPYCKVIYAIYTYKGFPMLTKMNLDLIRLTENGLVQKAFRDLYYLKSLRYNFRAQDYRIHFAVPWPIYVVGCVVSIIIFVIEILTKYKQSVALA